METEFNIESYSHSEDIPEMPEECAESERAMEELGKVSAEDKYSFINIIVLAVVLLACATYFISMTSSKRYGDEGNKFSFERLMNGKYTAEISSRYYSTIAYPEEIESLANSISRLYGFGSGIDYTDGTKTGAPENNNNNKGSGGGNSKPRETTSTTVPSETETETETSTEQREIVTFYDSVFSRTTTTSTELGWDPDDPYSHKTSPSTSANFEPPKVESTTTAETALTDKPTESDTETSPKETSAETSSETEKDTGTEPTETEVSETEPPETEPAETTCETGETPPEEGE